MKYRKAITQFILYYCTAVNLIRDSNQSDTRSLCGRGDSHPLWTILCQRKGIGQRHASIGRYVMKPGSSRSSSWAPIQEGLGMSISGCAAVAGTSWLNLATLPNETRQRARTMLMLSDVVATVKFGMKSFHLIERILCWHRIWNAMEWKFVCTVH